MLRLLIRYYLLVVVDGNTADLDLLQLRRRALLLAWLLYLVQVGLPLLTWRMVAG